MRILKYITISAILLLALWQVVGAQKFEPFKIELDVSKDTVMLGETFDLIVHVEYQSDLGKVHIDQPEFPELKEFEKVGSVGFSQLQNVVNNPITKELMAQVSYDFTRTYKTLKAGEFMIPGIELTIHDPAQPSGTLTTRTKGVKITVLDIAGMDERIAEQQEEEEKPGEDIHDIKDPIPAPQWVLYLLGAGGIAILLSVALLLTRLVKPRSVPLSPVSEVRKIINPYDRAIIKLKQIKIPGVGSEDDQITTYYIRLTDIVKEYLGTKYNVLGFEATSYEITESMRMVYKRIKRGDELIQSLERFLAELDLGKYAKAHRDENFMETALTRAREFIELDNSVNKPIIAEEEEEKLDV